MRWIVSAAVATALSGVAYSTPLAGNAPVALDDFAFFDGSGVMSLPLLDNDADPDGDALTVVNVSGPGAEFAQIGAGGVLTFTGPDGFYPLTYTVEDSEGLQSTASIQIFIFTFAPICGLVECG